MAHNGSYTVFRLLIFIAIRYKGLEGLSKRVFGLCEFLESGNFWTNSYGFY